MWIHFDADINCPFLVRLMVRCRALGRPRAAWASFPGALPPIECRYVP